MVLSNDVQVVHISALWQESLLALSKLREEVDSEKSRAQWDSAGHEKELEVSIRAKNNAWVIARVTRGKELYMVLEKANETLLYASDAVEKFSNRYCIFLFNDANTLCNNCRYLYYSHKFFRDSLLNFSLSLSFHSSLCKHVICFPRFADHSLSECTRAYLQACIFFELCRYCSGAFSLN